MPGRIPPPPPGLSPDQLHGAMTGVLPDEPPPPPRVGGPMVTGAIPYAEFSELTGKRPPIPFGGTIGDFHYQQMQWAAKNGLLGQNAKGIAPLQNPISNHPAFIWDKESWSWKPHPYVQKMMGRFKPKPPPKPPAAGGGG